MSQEKRPQGASLCVGNDLNAAATESLGLSLFHSHSNEDFALRPAPTLSRSNAPNHRFIHFDIAAKPRMFGMPDGTTKSV
jgi:hypothetical protein